MIETNTIIINEAPTDKLAQNVEDICVSSAYTTG